MKKPVGRIAKFVVLCALGALFGCVKKPASPVAGMEIAPCDIGVEGVAAECGALRIYENRDRRAGRVIPIKFIRVRASGENPASDAIFYLSGGPGAGATDRIANLLANAPARARRDFIVVDQRGTGGSNVLDCVDYDLETRPEAFAEMFEVSLFDAERFRDCKTRLQERADLTQYTTSIIADDINDLRAALGYEQMLVTGGSYGTTLGLEIIRRHGANVRAAVLTGAIPPSLKQTETIARDLQDGLDALFADCAADAACAAAFPDFEKDFWSVLETVRAAPVAVTLSHTLTQELETVLVRYEELIAAIRYSLYSTAISADLPLAVSEAKAGNYARLTQLLPRMLFLIAELSNEGMWASVRCAEEFQFLDYERARALSQGTALGTIRLDSGTEICSFWPRGAVGENFLEPVKSNVPVLLIAGEVDVATPPAAAREAARHLANSRLVVAPKRSHWGLGANECIKAMVETFVETADPASIDDTCLGELVRPPFKLPE